MAFGEEGGGHDRSPSATPHGVQKSAGQCQGDRASGFCLYGHRFMSGAPKDVSSHHEKVGADPRFEFGSVEVREEISAGDSPDHPWDGEFQAKGLVDVFVKNMTDPADSGGEDFRNFDAVTDEGGGNTEGEEKSGAGDPVGHAQGAVHDLSGQAHKHGEKKRRGNHDGNLVGEERLAMANRVIGSCFLRIGAG